MTSQGTQRTEATGRLLRRRTSNRVIGGVAGGLGDYFNVDPLLIRIAFVGLMIFGGAGAVLYLIAWLMVPAQGHDASIVESLLRRLGLTAGRIITLAVIAVAFVFLINSWNYPYDIVGDGSVLWAAVVIVLGFVLIRRREGASTV
ncbi:MAG TPA: PspC domain-containing protein, partial [Vicinamibacterales bacterium]|nr:PspC domain-containing protein [Vicinamibacterales bacterium]